MKKDEMCCPHHIGWGVLIALFGVFFLIANLVPDSCMIKFWPLFLIAAGIYKSVCCYLCKGRHHS